MLFSAIISVRKKVLFSNLLWLNHNMNKDLSISPRIKLTTPLFLVFCSVSTCDEQSLTTDLKASMYCAIKDEDNTFTTDHHWQMHICFSILLLYFNFQTNYWFLPKLLPLSNPLLQVTLERNDHWCAVGSIMKAYSCVNGTF